MKSKESNPRLPKTTPFQLYSEKADYVERALERIGPALDKICQDNHWHEDALKDRLCDDYFLNPASYSRIKNNDGKRRVSAAQLFELRRVSGISLDKLADGCEPFEFEQMSETRLVELMEQIACEMGRRKRQGYLPESPRHEGGNVV